MNDLWRFEGRRVEVEIDGERVRGRVVRGPARTHVLLEERGPVGDVGTGAHAKLALLRVWRARELEACRVVGELPAEAAAPPPPRRRKKPDFAKAVEIATSDPLTPPADWDAGQIAWAEAVHSARRQVDRSRKAMLRALKEAAS